MTLKEIVDAFNSVSLQHKSINEFYYGNSYDIAVSPKTKYPIVFLETPFNIDYSDNRRLKSYKFSLNVLFKTKSDNQKSSLSAISLAEDILDAILSKLQNDYQNKFIITGINALSLEDFSDDQLGGVRSNLTVSVNREYALPICYEELFDAPCEDC